MWPARKCWCRKRERALRPEPRSTFATSSPPFGRCWSAAAFSASSATRACSRPKLKHSSTSSRWWRRSGRRQTPETARQLRSALLEACAIHEVAHLAAVALLDETVDVGLEAGEVLVEAACELQVLDDGAIEALAGNEERNARRIGREQHARDAALQLVDLDAIDLAMRHAGERVRRLHRRLHVRKIHLGGHARDVVGLVIVVDLLAQVAQADPLVLG